MFAVPGLAAPISGVEFYSRLHELYLKFFHSSDRFV
jgi:hypothetical protein